MRSQHPIFSHSQSIFNLCCQFLIKTKGEFMAHKHLKRSKPAWNEYVCVNHFKKIQPRKPFSGYTCALNEQPKLWTVWIVNILNHIYMADTFTTFVHYTCAWTWVWLWAYICSSTIIKLTNRCFCFLEFIENCNIFRVTVERIGFSE